MFCDKVLHYVCVAVKRLRMYKCRASTLQITMTLSRSAVPACTANSGCVSAAAVCFGDVAEQLCATSYCCGADELHHAELGCLVLCCAVLCRGVPCCAVLLLGPSLPAVIARTAARDVLLLLLLGFLLLVAMHLAFDPVQLQERLLLVMALCVLSLYSRQCICLILCCLLLQLQERLPKGSQTHFRSIITDEFLRVKGSDDSIYAIGDAATIEQVWVFRVPAKGFARLIVHPEVSETRHPMSVSIGCLSCGH